MSNYKTSIYRGTEKETGKQRTKQPESKTLNSPVNTNELENASPIETPFEPLSGQHLDLLARAVSDDQRSGLVKQLQRTYGNNYVQNLLKRAQARAKMTVSSPGDAFEQEADRVAKAITAGLRSQPQSQGSAKTEVQSQPKLQLEAAPEEEEIQMQAADVLLSENFSQDIEGQINRARGSGRSLDDGTRSAMEGAFGANFSGVRVHTDAEADILNRQLNARAFTTGNDVFFRDGEYKPNTDSGKELLAHELTHVVQQTGDGIHRKNLEVLARSQVSSTQTTKNDGEGTLPDEESEEGLLKGPDDLAKAEKSEGYQADDSTTDKYEVDVDNINLGFESNKTELDSSVDLSHTKQTHRDVNVNVVWSNPGGLAVDPFGAEQFNPSYKGLKWALKGKKLKVNFNLDVKCPWGTNSGGCKDVPSATDSIVTIADHPSGKKVYEQIAADLTPFKKEQCWTAPREYYWSQALVEKHEKFHSTDDKKWAQGPGKKVVTDFLKGKKLAAANIESGLTSLLDQAIDKLEEANFAFYTGGAATYYSYAGEIRAFGHCKDDYSKMAKAVLKQGQKLEKEAKKKKK